MSLAILKFNITKFDFNLIIIHLNPINTMKQFLFFICFIFAFLQTSKAIPAEQKQNSEQKQKQILQIAILKQNEPFEFANPFSHYKTTYVVRSKRKCFLLLRISKKNQFLPPKNSKKPCKIPIKPQTRNKDNI